MPANPALTPASELARKSKFRFPNESQEYRRAREALLAEEIELRRHIERVAEQRRALPPGGKVTKDYRFQGERGPASFADLFGDKQTLVVYSYRRTLPRANASLPDSPRDRLRRARGRRRSAAMRGTGAAWIAGR